MRKLWGWTIMGFLVTGCLQPSRVTTTVDVRALLDADMRAGEYVVPAGTPEIARRSEPVMMDVAESARVGQLESAGFRFTIRFRHSTGNAAARVAVFAAARAEDVFAGEPLVRIEGRLQPGLEHELEREIEASPRLLELVRHGPVWFATGLAWEASAGEELTGDYEIARLEITMTSVLGGVMASAEPQPALRLEDLAR